MPKNRSTSINDIHQILMRKENIGNIYQYFANRAMLPACIAGSVCSQV